MVVAARRSPIGTAGHGLAALTVDRIAAPVLAAVAEQTSDLGLPVDDVILGNCLGPGGNVARISALAAGLGVQVPGVTVDRQCGSGLDAILQGAARIGSGQARLVLAGGAESASTAPWRFWPAAPGADPIRYTRAPFAPDGFDDPEMGPAADTVAALHGIGRERQDGYAARSHLRAVAARDAGAFDSEIVPVGSLVRDERPRAGLTAERLARLRPAFAVDGTVTAGNSCGISDGAAVVALVPEHVRAAAGLPGLRILGTAVSGSDPALPGLGPIPAVRKLLDDTGINLSEIEIFEITEAFAGQVLAVVDALGVDPAIVCPRGGAVALGHPWGASGAILVVRLFADLVGGNRLQPNGSGLAVATCAIGGGQGVAVLVEAVR
ncbi:thiolase family protein [Nakamurella silvestris]|nr:thiolase family protein [Nakamurella silvestris]